MRELINIHNAIVQYLPPVVPTDEQSQVCNAWLTVSFAQLVYGMVGANDNLSMRQ